MLIPSVREHLPCAWLNKLDDHISRAYIVGSWVARVLRKDRILEERIEVSPDYVCETDIERSVGRMGELKSQVLIGITGRSGVEGKLTWRLSEKPNPNK